MSAANMRLNGMKPAAGSKHSPKRVGRGGGSGLGKTCGRGHKGQRARAGGYHKVGFEGGQMPMQRRLPKVGFKNENGTAQVRLSELHKLAGTDVTLAALKDANIVPRTAKRAKVFLSGEVTKAFTLTGVAVTKGAAAAISQAGGKVEA